ncbi:MAG TPA: hypothetical protein VLJ59_13875, partial [Mycobacteriales bacterium]|nr:hypothetical protein [Mycobacteriales bacterium]
MTATRSGLQANPTGPDLAAAWYVAMPARRLGRRPMAVELFGRPLVAWRDGADRPVLAGRFC